MLPLSKRDLFPKQLNDCVKCKRFAKLFCFTLKQMFPTGLNQRQASLAPGLQTYYRPISKTCTYCLESTMLVTYTISDTDTLKLWWWPQDHHPFHLQLIAHRMRQREICSVSGSYFYTICFYLQRFSEVFLNSSCVFHFSTTESYLVPHEQPKDTAIR